MLLINVCTIKQCSDYEGCVHSDVAMGVVSTAMWPWGLCPQRCGYGGCVHSDVTMGVVSIAMSLVVVPRGEKVLVTTWSYPKNALPVKATSQTRVSAVLA